MSTIDNLKSCRAAIAALQKIADKCDSASGISFSVRRGVSRDDEDNENDAANRPWITAEVSDTAGKQAIEGLLSDLRISEKYWVHVLNREVSEASDFLRSIANKEDSK